MNGQRRPEAAPAQLATKDTEVGGSTDSPVPSKSDASVQDPPARAVVPDILARATVELADTGLVGEDRAAALVYLSVTSRLLEKPGKPVSLALKAPSSAGKSYVVKRVLELFPPSAYHALTAMSEKALAYSKEPLTHRMLVIYEATGMQGDWASYLIRSLLSEGHVRHETVDEKRQPLVLEREGPTGLIVTTTALNLHPENETRLLSVPVTDTPEQTRAILRAQASGDRRQLDAGPWWELQEWLAIGPREVIVPFAPQLAEVIPAASALRLRRDFPMLLALIEAHALLHRATRETDSAGRIVATLDDYAAVRDLTADLLAEGVRLTVSPETRETVGAVAAMVAAGATDGVSNKQIAARLELDESAASRRAKKARDGGHLINREDKRGKPARYVVGEPMPEEVSILPEPRELAEPCTVARLPEGGALPTNTTGPVSKPHDSDNLPVASDAEQALYERATRLAEGP